MRALFDFCIKYQLLLVFVLLEGLCIWLIVNKNSYQRVVFLTSTNNAIGYLLERSAEVQAYFNLQDQNDLLLAENAKLRTKIANRQAAWYEPDSAFMFKYEFIPAKVIKNSISLNQNFITIDKGSKHGLNAGDGVVTTTGIVGKIERCSDNYAIVRSVLHNESRISSLVRSKNMSYMLCTSSWDGKDFRYLYLDYLPQYRGISKGDSVLTSEYNSIYPEGYMIGKVVEVPKNNQTNQRVKVVLSHDFSMLRFVYVLKNKHLPEQQKLENNP